MTTEAWPLESRGTLLAKLVVTGVVPWKLMSRNDIVPLGITPEGPVFVTAALNVSDCPATTVRVSGTLDISPTPTPGR